MARPRIPPDRKAINFSLKLSHTDISFLDGMKEESGKVAIADVIREVVSALRTTFNLPSYQATRLHEDRQSRGLTMLQYVQELLAKRYEQLPAQAVKHQPLC